mmetsp:Transcript_34963/g.58571  ORF Transcript_34963/g.58571 Transcript_34963/m.58571 type:complete len:358 (+) Transcript_34963:954-2027(+)
MRVVSACSWRSISISSSSEKLLQSRTPCMASTRCSRFRGCESTFRQTAMRSSTWSRTPASSGLNVATSSGRHGNLTDTPSRSTLTHPSAKEDRRMLQSSSSRRLMSSTYRIPRCALASSPGWNTVLPCRTDSSTSTDPRRRSSMIFRGICTKGQSMISVSRSDSSCPASSSIFCVKVSSWSGLVGSMLNALPFTRSIGGMILTTPLAMTDLAVPRPPLMQTPPMLGFTVASSSAVLISSQPSTIDKGNGRARYSKGSRSARRLSSRFVASATASARALTSSLTSFTSPVVTHSASWSVPYCGSSGCLGTRTAFRAAQTIIITEDARTPVADQPLKVMPLCVAVEVVPNSRLSTAGAV